ncbi:MAG: alpha/beta hydrolase [Microthrixaceae bacterium]
MESSEYVADDESPETVSHPGAQRPARRYDVEAVGIAISVVEWGPEDAPPLLFAHGGFDFAETLNVFAPLLVTAGWRVVSWDHRGHGCSEWADLYSFEADLRDAAFVMDHVSPTPIPLVGHSKGGAVAMLLASAFPHRFTHLVNLDGMPSGGNMPDVAEHERTRMVSQEVAAWLDYRRSVADRLRKPGTIDELATRRGRMNTRMSHEWLRYLVTVGGRHDPDGWRWRIDPTLRMGGFGPWRPEWVMQRMPGLSMPFLAVLGSETEVMGWGTRPEDVLAHLPDDGRLEVIEGAGHFMHIEQPQAMADLIGEFVGAPR